MMPTRPSSLYPNLLFLLTQPVLQACPADLPKRYSKHLFQSKMIPTTMNENSPGRGGPSSNVKRTTLGNVGLVAGAP